MVSFLEIKKILPWVELNMAAWSVAKNPPCNKTPSKGQEKGEESGVNVNPITSFLP